MDISLIETNFALLKLEDLNITKIIVMCPVCHESNSIKAEDSKVSCINCLTNFQVSLPYEDIKDVVKAYKNNFYLVGGENDPEIIFDEDKFYKAAEKLKDYILARHAVDFGDNSSHKISFKIPIKLIRDA
jgi:hypothetical protein